MVSKRMSGILLLLIALWALAWMAAAVDENAQESIHEVVLRYALAERGEKLFNAFQEEAGFACATCHKTDTEERLIGPGLLNIGTRAADRVAGQSALDYIYISILDPGAHVVEGYPDDLMPKNWDDIYTTIDIYDMIAYLLTLSGEPAPKADVPSTTQDDSSAAGAVTVPISGLPATADPEHGAALFNTFQPEAGFACATCHWPDKEDRLIGPGLLNVGVRAETRVTGLNAIEYIYTSIINPDAYIVEGFPEDLMPENWAQIYSEDDILDIIAYLMTLRE